MKFNISKAESLVFRPHSTPAEMLKGKTLRFCFLFSKGILNTIDRENYLSEPQVFIPLNQQTIYSLRRE